MRDAFVAGYAPSAASPYYSSLVLLAEASRGADADLIRRIGEESDRVVLRRDDALADVLHAEEAIVRLRVKPPPSPSDADAYPGWAEAVFDAVNAKLRPGGEEAVAHLLGHVLGEGMATLDALAILLRLRAISPDHVLLRLQGESLEQERAMAERRLGRLASQPLLPRVAQIGSATSAHEVAEAAPAKGGGHAERAARADRAAQALAEQAAAIEAAV